MGARLLFRRELAWLESEAELLRAGFEEYRADCQRFTELQSRRASLEGILRRGRRAQRQKRRARFASLASPSMSMTNSLLEHHRLVLGTRGVSRTLEALRAELKGLRAKLDRRSALPANFLKVLSELRDLHLQTGARQSLEKAEKLRSEIQRVSLF